MHFIISVLMILLVDKLVGKFSIKNFWWAAALALVITVVTWLAESIF